MIPDLHRSPKCAVLPKLSDGERIAALEALLVAHDQRLDELHQRCNQHIELISMQAETILAMQDRLSRLEHDSYAKGVRIESLEKYVDELDAAIRGPR